MLSYDIFGIVMVWMLESVHTSVRRPVNTMNTLGYMTHLIWMI